MDRGSQIVVCWAAGVSFIVQKYGLDPTIN